MEFQCKNNKSEKWKGKIIYIKDYTNHYEIKIESHSSILVLFGKTTYGGFACIPDFNVGCHLANLKDKFWNEEKLTEILGEKDGITVATSLYILSDTIKI